MTDETQNDSRDRLRVFVTGSCDGLAEVAQALDANDELELVGSTESVQEASTALAGGHLEAVLHATRARLTISADTLRIDRLEGAGWEPWWRRPGPASHGVLLQVSNPIVVFGPNGMAWGASNTTIIVRRGSQAETITVSRVGRVKLW